MNRLNYFFIMGLFAGTLLGCGETTEEQELEEHSETTNGGLGPSGSLQKKGHSENNFSISGRLVNTLGLAGRTATHVVAMNTKTYQSTAAEIDPETGAFTIDVEKQSPVIISYVDSTAIGAEMLVGRFASGTLDALSADEGARELDMGEVSADEEESAARQSSHEDILAALGMTPETAETLGKLDDVSQRYINPDIDANGVIDALEGKSFGLDFHNRFYVNTENGTLTMKDLANNFPPNDVSFEYRGSGIIPLIATEGLTSTAYDWTLDQILDSYMCNNAVQNKVPAGTPCNITADSSSYTAQNYGVEVTLPPEGKYVLETQGRTFTWTNVKISDFSASEGFLALFIRFDVNAGILKSISYKWQRRGEDGHYVQATDAEIMAIVKEGSSGIDLKYEGMNSGRGIGVPVPLAPAGTIDMSVNAPYLRLEGVTKQELVDGIQFDKVLENPGISYDDKLGMRFLFSLNWD